VSARNSVLTGLLLPGLLLSGCASTDELGTIQLQLSDIQQLVLQIQKQTSSKQEIAELGDSVSEDMQQLVKFDADLRLALDRLAGQVDQLQAKLEDTNYRLAQLSQQIAATNQELKSIRSSPGFALGGQEGDSGSVAPADPQALYQTAYNDYLRGNYDLAILGFRQYLESFPDTDLADNASYCSGCGTATECHPGVSGQRRGQPGSSTPAEPEP
jgi:TolA-binding protein